MTATDMPTFRSAMTDQQLAEGFTTEARRLAGERDTARRALRVERADHAETKTELHRARVEAERLARRVAKLEQQLDQAQQHTAPPTAWTLPDFGRRL